MQIIQPYRSTVKRNYMKKEELGNIACENGLEIVETTSDRSGYPRGLGWAVIGFYSFEEAKELADKHGLQVTLLERFDGWQLWYNSKQTLYEAPTLKPEDLGYYVSYDNETDKQRVIKDCKEIIEGCDDMNEIRNIVTSRCAIVEELECLGDNEAIFVENPNKSIEEWEKVNTQPTSWIYDTHYYEVAIF